MTVRCYMVPVRTNPYTGKTEHAFVAASSTEEAADKVGQALGPARLAFPWLTDVDTTPAAVLPDGAKRNEDDDGTDRLPVIKHSRTREVMDWLREYNGRNTFAQDVKFKVENGRQYTGRNAGGRKAYRVTFNQIDALAKVKDREEEWAKQRAKAGTGLNVWAAVPYGTTRAAAENERGSLSFVRIDKVERGKWADWVFTKAILGDSEDMRLGSQRPDSEEYVGQWAVVLANVCKDPMAAVERYGTELGVCGVCNRRLTNEESRAGGIGPVCRGRLNRAA